MMMTRSIRKSGALRVVKAGCSLLAVIVAFSISYSHTHLSAAGSTYYVATTGNDSNSGTEASPFRTFNHGVSVLKPGDVLLIKAGTYAESNYDKIPSGTSWSAPVTVKAFDPANRPVIQAPSGADYVVIFEQPQSYIILDGLIVDAINATYNGIKITTGATHIRVQNTEVKNSLRMGILLTDGANFNEFINVEIHNARGLATATDPSGNAHGIYIATSDNLLDHVHSYSNASWGIHVYNDGGGVNRNVVRNCLVHNNGLSSVGDGIIVGSGNGNQVYNCVSYSNHDNGLRVQYASAADTLLYNNTVYNNGTGILVAGDAVRTIVQNNIAYGNRTDASFGGSGTTNSNNLIGGTSPGFMNAGAGNFHLASGSRAIDAGTAVSMVSSDADGVRRPQGSGYDIGAYEFSSTATAGAPAAPTNVRIK